MLGTKTYVLVVLLFYFVLIIAFVGFAVTASFFRKHWKHDFWAFYGPLFVTIVWIANICGERCFVQALEIPKSLKSCLRRYSGSMGRNQNQIEKNTRGELQQEL